MEEFGIAWCLVGVNSKHRVQRKWKCESHECCVCIVGCVPFLNVKDFFKNIYFFLIGVNQYFSPLRCFSLWKKRAATLLIFWRSINCDVLIGWHCWGGWLPGTLHTVQRHKSPSSHLLFWSPSVPFLSFFLPFSLSFFLSFFLSVLFWERSEEKVYVYMSQWSRHNRVGGISLNRR